MNIEDLLTGPADRPDHPDFRRLSDALLKTDGRVADALLKTDGRVAEGDLSFKQIIGQHVSEPDHLITLALEVGQGSVEPTLPTAGVFLDGFVLGSEFALTGKVAPPTDCARLEAALDAAHDGLRKHGSLYVQSKVNEDTVLYVANQRMLRVITLDRSAAPFSDHLVRAWLFGFFSGVEFRGEGLGV